MSRKYEITNKEWKEIKDLLPPENTGQKGRPRKDNRTMLNGMLWIFRSGGQWERLPERYGKWQSVYARFRKWTDDGTIELILKVLALEIDMKHIDNKSKCGNTHKNSNE